MDSACREYVKFYNYSDGPIDFTNTALHIGTLSSSSSTPLAGVVQPGEYALFATGASGGALEISNSGGYVWLSDVYGVTQYDNTIVEYADASSATHKGQSWALIDDLWQWGVPQPGGANMPLPVVVEPTTQAAAPTPCRSDQYRNPETNRCKLITTASTSLTPCAANQYRNPETNRCKAIVSASSTLTPCAAGQYRNPETNRCKAIATTASSLTPCSEGYERNPDTNRCRKSTVASIPTVEGAVETVVDGEGSTIGWLAFGSVAGLALSYSAWEWRREVAGLFSRMMSLLSR